MKAPSEEIYSKLTMCDFPSIGNIYCGRITYRLRDIFAYGA